MYSVTYNKFVKAYLVINTETKLAQGSWSNRLDALCSARDLNLGLRRSFKPLSAPVLKLISSN